MDTKPFWQSKTLILNVLSGLVMLLTGSDVLAILPKEYLPFVGALVAVLNMVLRVWYSDVKLGVTTSKAL